MTFPRCWRPAPDGHRLLTCGRTRMVRTWDLATGGNPIPPIGQRRRRGGGTDGRTAICGGEDKVVSVWRLLDVADTPASSRVFPSTSFSTDVEGMTGWESGDFGSSSLTNGNDGRSGMRPRLATAGGYSCRKMGASSPGSRSQKILYQLTFPKTIRKVAISPDGEPSRRPVQARARRHGDRPRRRHPRRVGRPHPPATAAATARASTPWPSRPTARSSSQRAGIETDPPLGRRDGQGDALLLGNPASRALSSAPTARRWRRPAATRRCDSGTRRREKVKSRPRAREKVQDRPQPQREDPGDERDDKLLGFLGLRARHRVLRADPRACARPRLQP